MGEGLAILAAYLLVVAVAVLAAAIWRAGQFLKIIIGALNRIEAEIAYQTEMLGDDEGPDDDGEPIADPAEVSNVVAIARRA